MNHSLFCKCKKCEEFWANEELLESQNKIEYGAEYLNFEQEKDLDCFYEKDGW